MDENDLLRAKIDALRDEVNAIASEMRHHAAVEREALRLRRILAARGICEFCGADLPRRGPCPCARDLGKNS